jgi:hypothetical protein
MTCGYIYKIKFPNGKHYVGLTTTSLKRRLEQHKQCAKQGDTKCLYNALRKYDMVDLLELIEIDKADTIEELCNMEIEYIKKYNSYYMNGNGYNMTFGGEGTNGYVFTEEDNKKNSERMKKYFENNLDARQQCSESQKKRFENPEARQQLCEAQKKRFENPEAKQQMSEAQKKRFENLEARQQLCEAQKKRFENPEARQQLCEAQKKRFENSDAREEMRDIKKKYFEDNPEAGKKHGKKMEKYYQDNPHARQKLSDGKGKNKPFDVFTVDGTFIKTFIYQFEAKEYLQKEHHITSTIKISEVLEGNRKSSAGFVFKYK